MSTVTFEEQTMSTEHYEPKVGDKVQWPRKQYGVWTRDKDKDYGTVKRIGDSGAVTVTPDRGGKVVVFRRSKYGRPYSLDPVSADEVARREWLAKEPDLQFVTMRVLGDLPRLNLDANECDAARIDLIAADLAAIKAWLGKRPQQSDTGEGGGPRHVS
jgi:hypothetical protein